MNTSLDKILLVEDDARIRDELCHALDRSGYETTVAANVAEARVTALQGCDLILLDLGLPDGDGVDFCREIRRSGHRTPIIIVTARDTSSQRVIGLDAGADDYVVKPFDTDVLLARMRSVLRRSRGHVTEVILRCGALWANTQARTAGRGEKSLDLTPREFDLFAFFLRHPSLAWTRDQILERVWGLEGGRNNTRTVDIHVTRLRSKIEPEPSEPVFLVTVWGHGYRLREPEETS